MLSVLGEQQPSITLTSDASGSWGCGAHWGSHLFQLAWGDTVGQLDANIATKELIPIVIAVAMWGRHWTGQVVCCRCDNMAVVSVLNHCTSRDGELIHLLRCLAFFEAKFSCRLVAAHIAGSLQAWGGVAAAPLRMHGMFEHAQVQVMYNLVCGMGFGD